MGVTYSHNQKKQFLKFFEKWQIWEIWESGKSGISRKWEIWESGNREIRIGGILHSRKNEKSGNPGNLEIWRPLRGRILGFARKCEICGFSWKYGVILRWFCAMIIEFHDNFYFARFEKGSTVSERTRDFSDSGIFAISQPAESHRFEFCNFGNPEIWNFGKTGNFSEGEKLEFVKFCGMWSGVAREFLGFWGVNGHIKPNFAP